MEWKHKKTVIAAPRPVAPIALRNSGNALPAVFAPDFSHCEEDMESSYDLEAETELQQIFGFSRVASGMELRMMEEDVMMDEGLRINRGGCSSSSEFDDYPFLALGSPSDSPLEFPRLGLSPFSMAQQPELEYPLPTRARNPVTLNTPFSPKDHQLLEYQAAMTQTLKLALVGMEHHQTRTRNRSYSEPIPFYVE